MPYAIVPLNQRPLLHEEERVLEVIESKRSELASMLQRLVRFESVNPPGNEGPISRNISERLERSGFEVQLVEVAKGRPNVVGSLRGTTGKPRLLVYGHSDVVPAGDYANWTYPPFDGKIINDEVHGRGAQDHKFPIPPIIIAADAIREVGLQLKGDLVVTIVADEETGGNFGFKWLVENRYFNDTDCMLYGGPASDGNSVIVSANGQLVTQVIVRGIGAHTGNLEKGVNAIVRAVKVISRLQNLAEEVNQRSHPLTGKARMSINMIQAGEKINVLPDKCIITIDRRITPSESFESVHAELESMLKDLRQEDPSLDIELVTEPSMQPVAGDPNSEIVRVLKGSGSEIMGVSEVVVTGIQGSSDFSWYVNNLGKPAAAYSISSAEPRGHAPNEYAKIDDLVKTAKAYALTYMRYLGTEPR